MAASPTLEDELAEHVRAYLFLLDSVLKKSPLDLATKSTTLKRLRDYLDTNIRSTDEFIDHIPEFARMIGVPEKQLSQFIGSNFLKALHMLQQGGAEARSGSNDGAASRGEGAESILNELLSLPGYSWNPAHRFVSIDFGLLKIVRPEGDLLPAGYANYYGAQAAQDLPAKERPPQPEEKSAPKIVTVASTRQKKEEREAPPEIPILDEILQKFGPILSISERLVPSDGIVEEIETERIPVLPEAVSVVETVAEQPSTPLQHRVEREVIPEKPVIDEILEKFGSILSIRQRLEPEGEIVDSSVSSDEPDEAEQFGAPEHEYDPIHPPTVEPLPFSFGEYYGLVQIVHSYQKTGDRDGYNRWANGAPQIERAVLRIRGLIQQEKGNATPPWELEYAKIARFLNIHESSVRELKERIEKYEGVQRALNELTRELRDRPPLVAAVKTCWNQIRELLEEPTGEYEVIARLKILLLQVEGDAARIELFRIIEPQARKIARIFAGE